MAWLQLQLFTQGKYAALMSEVLESLGAEAVTFQDGGDEPFYEPTPENPVHWGQTIVTGLFAEDADIDTITSALQRQLPDLTTSYKVTTLEDQPWERAWMDRFHPMLFGKRLWICPSWCEPPDKEAVTISLDPGLAFGTGTHPTTALCLEWLDGHSVVGQTCIDYGCGSGILAIAALKLGAKQVWAVDTHPQALEATHDNRIKNGLAAEVLLTGFPQELPPIQADILLANILAEPLIALAPHFATLVKEGADLVLSGILREQASKVMAAYEPFFTFGDTATQEEWVRLTAKRKVTILSND